MILILLIQQIFFPQVDKFVQPILPVLGNPSWIFSRSDRLKHCLIRQQIGHLLYLEIIRIKFMQRRRQLNSQLRRLQSISVHNNQVHAFTSFAGKITR